MSNLELYKEVKIPSLVKEIKDIFPYINVLANKFNTSKSLYSARTLSFHNSTDKLYDPFFKIVKKYPFLNNFFRVFNIVPGGGTIIHLDGLNQSEIGDYTINIPISGCSKFCPTEFFKVSQENIFSDLILKTRTIKEEYAVKIDEYFLIENPFLCSHQIPHRVKNNSNVNRISISWAIKTDWPPVKILELIETGIYNV